MSSKKKFRDYVYSKVGWVRFGKMLPNKRKKVKIKKTEKVTKK